MSNNENKRARKRAQKHAKSISVPVSFAVFFAVEKILYFIYNLFDEDRKPISTPPMIGKGTSENEVYSSEIIVALFVNSTKSQSLCNYIKQTNRLDQTIMRDLYTNTEYMWSGLTTETVFNTIIELFNYNEETSKIPEMDFNVIIIPVDNLLKENGIGKNDSTNRVEFFEKICSCSPQVRISNKLSYEKLPKSFIYTKS